MSSYKPMWQISTGEKYLSGNFGQRNIRPQSSIPLKKDRRYDQVLVKKKIRQLVEIQNQAVLNNKSIIQFKPPNIVKKEKSVAVKLWDKQFLLKNKFQQHDYSPLKNNNFLYNSCEEYITPIPKQKYNVNLGVIPVKPSYNSVI